ncbi:MAG: DUF4390 domain-containing protein [Burkholderiaceae bacterium]
MPCVAPLDTNAPPRALQRTGRAAAAWPGRGSGQEEQGVGRGLCRQAHRWLGHALLLLALLWPMPPVQAANAELSSFEMERNDEGLWLSYAVDFELPRGVDEALNKAVPLFFVAEAEVFRSRWYWSDLRVGHAQRIWRIVFQPLTATWRVTFGGLSQNYKTREEAFAAISRGAHWKIAEAGQLEEGSHHYLEFSYRLDTSLLPRPMQIGLGGQPDWTLSVQRTQRID